MFDRRAARMLALAGEEFRYSDSAADAADID